MPDIKKFIDGYRHFYQKYFVENDEIYKKLARHGQSPIAALIACSDSRADPSLITGAEPGEMFVIRNVANLVPPFQDDDSTYHGTSAALEFAVNILEVKNVIVFGHSKCAGIRALVNDDYAHGGKSFVNSWMKIADDVRRDVIKLHPHLEKHEQAHICEKKAIEKSLQNLMTFPWIAEKVNAGKLTLHGWHFDIEHGQLFHFDKKSDIWTEL